MGSEPVSGSGFPLGDVLLCWEDVVRGVIPYGRCDRLHSLETLKQQQFILPQSGGQKSEAQVCFRGRVPGPLQPRGRRLQPPDLSHCPHLAVLTAQLLISPQSRVPRFTLITAARPCFQIRSQSRAPGAPPSSYLREHHGGRHTWYLVFILFYFTFRCRMFSISLGIFHTQLECLANVRVSIASRRTELAHS